MKSLKFLPLLVIVAFTLLQCGDVIFGNASLDTVFFSPAMYHQHFVAYHGWLEDSFLNRFPPQMTGYRGFWDRPLVNDPFLRGAFDMLFSGEFPFLNPYNGMGSPYFGAGFDSLFTVPTLILALLPQPAWDYLFLALFVLSGITLYRILTRYYKCSSTAALAASIAFLSSGLFPPQMVYGSETINIHFFIYGVFFIEWMRCGTTLRARFLRSIPIILIMAQSIYVGMPEATVANFFMWLFYFFLRLPLCSKKEAFASIVLIGSSFSIALLIAAPHLIALLHNMTSMSTAHLTGRATIPWHFLPDLFLPYLSGWISQSYSISEFPGNYDLKYIGLLPLFGLACAGLRGVSLSAWKPMFPWIALFLLFFVNTFGDTTLNLNFVGFLPIFNKIWFFRYFAPLFLFAILLLTAHSLTLYERSSQKLVSWWGIVCAIGIALLYVGALYFKSGHLRELGKDQGAIDGLYTWNRTNTVFVTAYCALILVAISRIVPSRIVVMLALTLTIGAGTMNFSKSFLPKADAFNVTPGVRFLKKRLKRETFRIYSPEMFYPSLASAFRIPDIRYLSAIVPNSLIDSLTTVLGPLGKDKVAFDRFETVNAIPSGFDHPSYDILNVRYFVFSKDSPRPPVSPSLKLVYDGEDMKIIENRDSMRSYFAMKAWKIYSSLPAMKEELWKAPEGMREVIPLLEEPIFVPLASPSPARNKIVGKESVKLTSENNHTHIFKVNLDAPRLLTISQVLMPGYRALRSDGAELPILSSYGGLITVPLSSGEYSVTLRYRPFYWTASLVACGFGLLVLIGGGVWLRVTSQLLP